MIHRLEIENFYSVRDRQVIDLRAAGNAPEDAERLSAPWPGASERVPKVVSLFGANASGKSNVLKALSFLAWFVRSSFKELQPREGLPYQRFLDSDGLDRPTRLAVHFGGVEDLGGASDPRGSGVGPPCCGYAYEVSLGGAAGEPTHVLSETLRYWPSHSSRQVKLFERSKSGEVNAGQSFRLAAGHRLALEKVLRPNASVISTLAQLGHPASTVLAGMGGTVFENILVVNREFTDANAALYFALNRPHLEKLNACLRRLDLGLSLMEVQEGTNGPLLWFVHEGLTQRLPQGFESHGTRLFVRIFPLIVQALEAGGVAVIDEMDLAIHPLVLPEILGWFYGSQTNPHNAQLWMTCQNASLLEELIKEEIWFCEKDGQGRTSVYGLKDIRDVRRVDNYYRKYLGGVYGAVPRIG